MATLGIAQLGQDHSLQEKGKEGSTDLYLNSHTSVFTLRVCGNKHCGVT